MNLVGKAADPAFWVQVREEEVYKPYRDALQELWQTYCTGDIPNLCYHTFRLFQVTGDRHEYETPYFNRRMQLCVSALLSLIYPEENRYLVRLMDVIYAVCDEYTWCLPAHQPKEQVNNETHIDLFAAETGFTLSEMDTIFGDRLEPLIRDRIRVEVEKRIIESFRSTSFFWEKVSMNWAAVCGGSVGCTILLRRPDLADELLPRIRSTMEYFLKGFRDDGICDEGLGYWDYGFGYFIFFADMLRRFTDGKEDYFKREKVRKIASFPGRMYLDKHTTVSFSDSKGKAQYMQGTIHYLKREYPDEVYLPEEDLVNHSARWTPLLRSATWFCPELAGKHDLLKCPSDDYAPDRQWLMSRRPGYAFAAKGGTNCESHNHHDVGSFIFVKHDHQILTDPGSGDYTRQYFEGQHRYETVACGSHGHSLPILGDGIRQSDGGKFSAKDVTFDGHVFRMDLSSAYECPEVRHIVRSFTLHDDSLTLCDTYTKEDGFPVTERLVSNYPFEIGDGVAVTDEANITFDPALYTLSVSSAVVSELENRRVYFLDFALHDGVNTFEVTVS